MPERETYPKDYSEPNWLWSLEQEIPSQWSNSRQRWEGLVVAFGVMVFFMDALEVGRLTCALIHMIGFIISSIGFLGSRSSFSPTVKSLTEKLTAEKARADSYARVWTKNDIAILRKHILWTENWHLNIADDVYAERKAKWWKRMFWERLYDGKIPAPIFEADPTLKYLISLAREVQARAYEGR